MSGDRLIRPTTGTAAGVPYIALPPTAIDAEPAGAARLIVAWPGLDPPRTETALATAVPMTGVPVWRVFLGLPGAGPDGLESAAFIERHGVEGYGEAVERAVELLPMALDDIRRDLGLDAGPIGLSGFSAGGAAAFLALTRGGVQVCAAALVAPVVSPARTVAAVERRRGLEYAWQDRARDLADRLDLTMRAADRPRLDTPLLLIGGAADRLVPPSQLSELRDRLLENGAQAVETATFRMGHALAPEPGTEARPPITAAVSVDGALTDWFREHLATEATGSAQATGSAAATGSAQAAGPAAATGRAEPASHATGDDPQVLART